MANLIRHTATWTGAPGLPGYSQFYQEVVGDVAAQAQGAHDVIGTFFDGLAPLLPEEVTVTVNPIYQVVNLSTGALVGEDAVATPFAAVAGEYVGGWNAQVGVLIEWLTGSFVGRRRLRGRTYLVPLGAVSETDGTLPATTVASALFWANVIVTSGQHFVVWHRPVNGAGGQVADISSAVVRDHAAMLRSRMV